jgi:hypothetical protein
VTPPSAELIGFGQYADKTREWVWEHDRGYLDWAVVTMFESVKPNKQISDLAQWTLLREETEKEDKGYTQTDRPARPAAKRAPTMRHRRWAGSSAASSSDWTEVTEKKERQ